jgi:hypothetical protein
MRSNFLNHGTPVCSASWRIHRGRHEAHKEDRLVPVAQESGFRSLEQGRAQMGGVVRQLAVGPRRHTLRRAETCSASRGPTVELRALGANSGENVAVAGLAAVGTHLQTRDPE